MCMFCHGLFRRFFGNNMISGVFIFVMRCVVVGLNAMPLYLMNYEMNEWMTNKVDMKLVKVLFNYLVFMTLLSYGVATFKRPKVIPQTPPPDQKMYCQMCRNWKPQRTHHCSICNVCVPKMDHHCPWIGNCVGYHNFKAFFLFCFYQACVGQVYAWRMILFSFFSPDETPDLTTLGTVCFYLTNLVSLTISIALIPLTLRIIVQLYNNLTTIEMMKNKQTKYPCVGGGQSRTDDGRLEHNPNEHDMLWLQNMKQVLGTQLWMWPFPFAQEMRGKGLFYPRIPDVSDSDVRAFNAREGRVASVDTRRGYSGTADFDSDPQEYIDKAVKKYAGNTFVLPNQEDPDAEGDPSSTGHQSFFIPKTVKENQRLE